MFKRSVFFFFIIISINENFHLEKKEKQLTKFVELKKKLNTSRVVRDLFGWWWGRQNDQMVKVQCLEVLGVVDVVAVQEESCHALEEYWLIGGRRCVPVVWINLKQINHKVKYLIFQIHLYY